MKRQHLQILCAWALMVSGLTAAWAGPRSCLEKADFQKPEMEQFVVDKPIFDEPGALQSEMDKDVTEKPTFEKPVFDPIRFQKGERDYCGSKHAGVWTVEVKDVKKKDEQAMLKAIKQQEKAQTVKIGREKVRMPALSSKAPAALSLKAGKVGCGCPTTKLVVTK